MDIGFIGLGAMGLPIALNLKKAGHNLCVCDAFPAALDKAAGEGLTQACTVDEAAVSTEVMFLSLPNAAIVEGVVKNIVAAKPAGLKAVADLSSIAPASARRFAALLGEVGIGYADCPVSGGVQGAVAGTLSVMVGAAPEVYDLIGPLLAVIGKKIYPMGEVGKGSAIKMVNNFLLGCNMAAVAEALVLGTKLGLDAATMQEVIQNSSGRSFITENKIPNFIMKRKFDGGFQVDLAYKDLGLSAESARMLEMPIPMGSAAIQVFETARAKGLGKEDISSLVKIWEDLMGVEVR